MQWRPWGAAALAEARRRQVPVLVAVGYFSCRWCRVMGEESFADATVGALMNERFVPVLVDRELELALDARLRRFVTALEGRYGWPVVVALTPAGDPFAATLYRPREAFLAWLRALDAAWRDSAPALVREARRRAASRGTGPPPAPLPRAQLTARLHEAVWARADELAGGFGEVAKFPLPALLISLWRLQQAAPREETAAFLATTLDAMASGALFDALGGGFFRYATAPDWSAPHFEKMAADNAQLAWLYMEAGAAWGRPEWLRVGRRTLAFLRREMALPEGGFGSALAAVDAAGRDGGVYRIGPEVLARLAPEVAARLRQRWGLQGPLTDAAGWLPRPRRPVPVLDAWDRRLLALRGRAALDEKWLTAVNALALEAYLRAWRLWGEARDRATAAALARQLRRRSDEGRQVVHGVYRGQVVGQVVLLDAALTARALDRWARAVGDEAACRAARRAAAWAFATFFSPQGWRMAEETPPAAVWPERALPSGAAVATGLGLGHPDAAVRAAARRARALAAMAQEAPFWYLGTLLNAVAPERLACRVGGD